MTAIEQCEGYKKLMADAQKDRDKYHDDHGRDYFAKVQWAVDRAQHYAEKTGIPASVILDTWENNREYWYMNYYQDANQPLINGDRVRVFETLDDYLAAVGNLGFRCPRCGGVSSDARTCDSGVEIEPYDGRGPCDWKAYGLLGTMGNGLYVFVKELVGGEGIFMPLAFEQENANADAGDTAVPHEA